MVFEVLVMGASSGGHQALSILLAALPAPFPLPMVLVQHRLGEDSDALATSLASRSPHPVLDVEDKYPITPGQVHLAPAGYHLLLGPDGFQLSTAPPVHYSRPSIDVLFESAAHIHGPGVLAVILTGSSADGAEGAAAIVRNGGTLLVQYPASAESSIMPAAALAAVPTALALSLPDLAVHIASLCPDSSSAARPSPLQKELP